MSTDVGSTPVKRRRIEGYDLARAWAIVGMVIVNFKVVMGAEQGGPSWLGSATGLLEGRAAATFVVLAGIGITLLTRRARESEASGALIRDRTTLLKRAAFLFVVGLSYTPIWPADILHFYGVYIAVAAFLIAAPTRRLWTLASVLVIGFVVLLFVWNYETGWDFDTLTYEGLWTPAGIVRHLFYNGFHPVVPWLAFLLLGMIVGRYDLTDRAVRWRTFLWGAGVAAAAESVSRFLLSGAADVVDAGDMEDVVAVFGTEMIPPMPLYMLAGAGTAVAVICVGVALGERFAGSRWLRPWVSTGQLALTLYVAHVVIGMGTLEAMGRLENQTLPFALLASSVFCVAGIVFAHLWRKRFRRGPLEAVMRRLTDPR